MEKTKLLPTLIIQLILALCLVQNGFTQCECTNCPLFVDSNTSIGSTINIGTADSPTLGVDGQQVCQVCINIDTDAIKELFISLESPSGEFVTLTLNTGININANMNFDICFLSCDQTVVPDSGHADIFDSNDNWAENSNYTGTYYPIVGCLEDFTGSVDGDWNLSLSDFVGGDHSTLLDWSISFTDNGGLNCANDAGCSTVVCDADAGVISTMNTPTCPTEDITFSVSDYNADPLFAQYILVVDDAGIVIDFIVGDNGFFNYEYCGDFTIYSYNYELAGTSVEPHIGDDISTYDCVDNCCDLEMETISFEDNMAPFWVDIPPHPNFPSPGVNVMFFCVEEIPLALDAEYGDNCIANGFVEADDTDFTDPCLGGTYHRRWEVGDSCFMPIGIASEYIITVEPTAEADYIDPPTDYMTTCDNVPTSAPNLMYTNGVTGPCMAIEGDGIPNFQNDYNECGGELLITWSAIDECGRVVEHTQTITVEITPKGEFISTPDDETITCDMIPDMPPDLIITNGATGGCLIDETVSATVEDNFNGCEGTIIYTWEYTDACGRLTDHVQVITIEPSPLANFVSEPPAETVLCTELNLVPSGLAYENGSFGDCEISGVEEALITGNYNFCGGDLTYTWTHIDACGRTITYAQFVTVLAGDLPYFIDVPDDITLDCDQDTYIPPDLEYTNDAIGDCGSSGFVPGSIVDNGSTIDVTWELISTCDGSLVTANQTVTLADGPDVVISPTEVFLCLGIGFELTDITVTDLSMTGGSISYHDALPISAANELTSTFVTPLESTTYFIAVTDANGCVDAAAFTVIVEEIIEVADGGSISLCNDITGFSLFVPLSSVVTMNGAWEEITSSGIDITDPLMVSFLDVTPGEYQFSFTSNSANSCLPDVAIATINLFEALDLSLLSISCAADQMSYTVEVQATETSTIDNSMGDLSTLGDGIFQIANIPIAMSLTVQATEPISGCADFLQITPPDCSCPEVDPPMADAVNNICPHEAPITLTAIPTNGNDISWYEVAIGGTSLASNTEMFTALDIDPGAYTYFVESIDSDGCVSSIRTPISFTILAPPNIPAATSTACSSSDTGESIFSLVDIISDVTFIPDLIIGLYSSAMNANDNLAEVTEDIVIANQQDSIIFARIEDVNGCYSIVEITLHSLDIPMVNILAQEENCFNESDGSITITFDDPDSGILSDLDGMEYDGTNEYNSLSAATYMVNVIDSNFCTNTFPVVIDPGFSLIIDSLNFECDDLGTINDSTDDIWIFSFNLSTDGNGSDYSLTIDGMEIGSYTYGNTYTITLIADDLVHTILFVDPSNMCGTPVSSPVLISCSTPCTEFPDATIFFDPANSIDCSVSEVILSAIGETNVVYTWSLDGQAYDPITPITDAGMITLVAIDTLTGCSAEGSIQIDDLVSYPIVNIAEPDIITCTNNTIVLDGSASQQGTQITYTWLDAQQETISGANTDMLTVLEPGWYYLEVTDVNILCVSLDSVEVTEDANRPIIDLEESIGPDCGLVTTDISAMITNEGNGTILWSTNNGAITSTNDTPNISVSESGTYYITVTNLDNMCTEIDSIVFVAASEPFVDLLSAINESCLGASDGQVSIDIEGGTAPYEIIVGSEIVIGGMIGNLSPGSYAVTAIDVNGCAVDTSVTIELGNEVLVDMEVALEYLDGEENIIEVNTNVDEIDITSIMWSPSDGLSCDDCLSPTVVEGVNQSYTITIIDAQGCFATATTLVSYEEVIIMVPEVIIPNVFSPNDDGTNDNLIIRPIDGQVFDYLEMRIYDRWGELVFFDDQLQSADDSSFWDGSFNGSKLNPGVYVYIVKVKLSSSLQEEVLVGDVTLIK